MKKITRLSTCLLFLTLLIPASLALAKGSPDKIAVDGPGLATPIEVADPETLKAFESIKTPISSFVGRPYRISFFDKNDHGEFSQAPNYVLLYYPNPSGGPGYVFDPYVASESRWYQATSEGEAAMQRLLKNNEVSPTLFASASSNGVMTYGPWIFALVITLANGSVTLWLLRRVRHTPA